ncbi:Fe-S-cluster redox enzyme [Solibacillus sp. FSL H8-0538]|uniref:Fe-S-cluster redox enzyme n=1 Tax=Solibacillus sp. FSL H8-0538 TaxID=2921400 RepID=UPI0030F96193
MLKCDEQLMQATQGQTGERLEKVINAYMQDECMDLQPWRAVLPVDLILTDEECAEEFCFLLLKKYWKQANLLFVEPLQAVNLDIEFANERIQLFFESPQNKSALFNYLVIHSEMRFEHLIALIFGKTMKEGIRGAGLECLYVHKIDGQYFVQAIYCTQSLFWETVYAKKLYSIFQQVPLHAIDDPLILMKNFKMHVLKIESVNRTATIIHKLIQRLDHVNPQSFQLKQLHLFNVITHFTSGRRHFLKLKKCIEHVEAMWGTGHWALNEKERTLLSYILLNDAVMKKDREKVIEHGLFLIEQDRLNNHAVELVVEYSDVLKSMKPQPEALVKNYKENYLEYVFFVVMDALVEKQRFGTVFRLLQEHELASCTAIYDVVNTSSKAEVLHKIEATVQRDIAFLVDSSPQYMLDSVRVWQEQYTSPTSPYWTVAEMTSWHICNVLKTVFVEEQYEVFEKLMSVYKKYLVIPSHVERLREFIEEYIVKQGS